MYNMQRVSNADEECNGESIRFSKSHDSPRSLVDYHLRESSGGRCGTSRAREQIPDDRGCAEGMPRGRRRGKDGCRDLFPGENRRKFVSSREEGMRSRTSECNADLIA